MKRKDIKIGETYGVVLKATSRATPVPAKVVGLDAPYSARSRSGWSSHEIKKNDGVRVVFREDMRVSYDSFEPRSECAKRMTDKALKATKWHKAGVVHVLPGSKCVVEPWADIAARRASIEADLLERAKRTDQVADTVEPKLRAVIAAMNARGIYHGDGHAAAAKVVPRELRGVEARDRVVDATFKLSLDAMAKLLGVGDEAADF
jgi:hypothetical protein